MRRQRRARSRATNFATAHGEPAPDGVGRRTGHSTARERGASPGGATYDRGVRDGTASGRRRRGVGAGRGGDRRVGASGRGGRGNGYAGGRGDGGGDGRRGARGAMPTTRGMATGGESNIEIQNQNGSRPIPPSPALRTRPRACRTWGYLRVYDTPIDFRCNMSWVGGHFPDAYFS